MTDQMFNERTMNNLLESKRSALDRWRLILGKKAEDQAIKFSSQDKPQIGQQGQMGQQSQREQQGQMGQQSQMSQQGQTKRSDPRGYRKPGQHIQYSQSRQPGYIQKIQPVTGQSSQAVQSSQTSQSGQSGPTGKAGYGRPSQPEQQGIPGYGQHSKTTQSSKVEHKYPNQSPQSMQGWNLNQLDNTLDFVYGRRNQERGAGLGGSHLSIPKWIENVKKFFPQETKELLEKDFIERSDIKDIIKNPELFEKVEPSLEMVKVIIGLKHMLPENIKEVARKIVKKVVNALKDKFKDEVKKHITGAIRRDKHTPIKVFRNIDWKQSIMKNLKHYDPILEKLIMGEPRFFSAEKRKKPWQIVVLIDESGSMTDSVIYSIVMASIFATLPAVKTNLIIFDTQVVDLSDKIDDPVDVLMTVQLGGGTDITRAVRYGQSLIKNPKKAIMVIISDFYEGRGYDQLTKALKQVLEGQTKILGIAALGYNSEPMFNREYAKQMNELGIDVLACTPNSLPELIAKLMK